MIDYQLSGGKGCKPSMVSSKGKQLTIGVLKAFPTIIFIFGVLSILVKTWRSTPRVSQDTTTA